MQIHEEIMKIKRLPKSLRKYVRREKTRIRQEVLGLKEQEKLISELCQKYFKTVKEDKSFFPPSSH